MKDDFYIDEFESFLKESADQFRMYPSKKVWHSLYNDLHPGRKWPSLAVTLLLISAVLYVGIYNNNSINNNHKNNLKDNLAVANNISNNAATDIFTPIIESGKIVPVNHITSNSIPIHTAIYNASSSIPGKAVESISTLALNSHVKTNSKEKQTIVGASPNAPKATHPFSINENNITTFITTPVVSVNRLLMAFNDGLDAKKLSLSITKPATELKQQHTNQKLKTNTSNLLKISIEDKSWMEDYAFQNKAKISNWKRNASFEFYITPSVGFRQLYKNNQLAPVALSSNNSGLVATNTGITQPLEDKITQSYAANLEMGGVFLYNISKRMRLKAGLQLNYTSYNIEANELVHPSQSNLLLNNLYTGAAYLSPRISFYANSINTENRKSLKNRTIQIAMPIGAEYRLAGLNNLKWYAGASIQPTYIIGGHLYALSADEKNYIEDGSLLRKWNLNASVETFLSYKTPSGLIISAGPQLRRQFLSTYDKRFTYTERLYNFGLKLGLTSNF